MRRSAPWLILLALGLCAAFVTPKAALADGPVNLTLTMTRTDGAGPLAVGGEAGFRLLVHNSGPVNTATGVEVAYTLPDGLTLVGQPAACTRAAQVVTCTAESIAAFDELFFDLRVRAEPSAAERTLTNRAIATADEALVAGASNEASLDVEIGPYSALEATMSAAAASVAAGSSATFSATVRNDGPSAASGVRLIDLLPEGLRLRSATPSQGACAGAVCDLGGLPAGASAQLRIVAGVNAAAGGRRVEPWQRGGGSVGGRYCKLRRPVEQVTTRVRRGARAVRLGAYPGGGPGGPGGGFGALPGTSFDRRARSTSTTCSAATAVAGPDQRPVRRPVPA